MARSIKLSRDAEFISDTLVEIFQGSAQRTSYDSRLAVYIDLDHFRSTSDDIYNKLPQSGNLLVVFNHRPGEVIDVPYTEVYDRMARMPSSYFEYHQMDKSTRSIIKLPHTPSEEEIDTHMSSILSAVMSAAFGKNQPERITTAMRAVLEQRKSVAEAAAENKRLLETALLDRQRAEAAKAALESQPMPQS